LLQLRKEKAYGTQQDYFDNPHCIGWVRRGDALQPGSGCAVLLNNHPDKTFQKQMQVGQQFAGQEFYDALGNIKDTITIDADGNGQFSVPPQQVAVWVQKP
jgi:alpha-amylase